MNDIELQEIIDKRSEERLSKDKKFFPRNTTIIIEDVETGKEYKNIIPWKTIKELSVLHDIDP